MKSIVIICTLMLCISSVFAISENPYSEQLSNNEDISVLSGGHLTSIDLQGYSGTARLSRGSSAELPEDFQGTLVLIDAKVTLHDGRIVRGTGSCDKAGCTILEGETGEGDTKVSDGAFRVKNDGSIDVFAYATIGEGNSARKVFHITNHKNNGDGTISFGVEEGSEVAGVTIGTKGTIVFDPLKNSIKPSVDDSLQNTIFRIKSFDRMASPVILNRDNIDIQVDQGMYLIKGSTLFAFSIDDCNDNCVLLPDEYGIDNRIIMKGEQYTIRFDENNPIVNVYPQDKLSAEYEIAKRAFFKKYNMPEDKYDDCSFGLAGYPGEEAKRIGISEKELQSDYDNMEKLYRLLSKPSVMEISPRGGTLEIENRNAFYSNGILGISEEKTQAPKITITGDLSDDVWADIKNDGIMLQAGNNGLINPRIPRRGETEEGIPIELNILDEYGNSLIIGQDGREIKASITSDGGIYFSTMDANVISEGTPHCSPLGNSFTGTGITANAIKIQGPGCKDDYFNYNAQFSSKAAIDAARDEYINYKGQHYEFKPEYENDGSKPEHIFSSNYRYLWDEQIELLNIYPDYSEPVIFYNSDDAKDYIMDHISPEKFKKITFLPCSGHCPIWNQDPSEGDRNVRIVPLTYLGESRKEPSYPGNEFVYGLEELGTEVRKIPVEFGGGNVYISEDKNGRKVLLTGGDSYLETVESYSEIGDSISESDFKDVMKNAFNVDDVLIVATRDNNGQFERQHRATFHIDQVMLPIDDGVVAMPVIELTPPTETQEVIFQEKKQRLIEFAQKHGLQPEADWDISTKYYGAWKGFWDLPDDQRENLEREEREIRESFDDRERAEDYYETATEVKHQVDQYRKLMESNGFEVIDLKSDPKSVGNYQAYTNSIVYQDKNTGQKTVIMPIFPDASGEYKMEGINLENKKAFEKAGFEVKTVKDRAYRNRGNLHCITILAQAPQICPDCDLSFA